MSWLESLEIGEMIPLVCITLAVATMAVTPFLARGRRRAFLTLYAFAIGFLLYGIADALDYSQGTNLTILSTLVGIMAGASLIVGTLLIGFGSPKREEA